MNLGNPILQVGPTCGFVMLAYNGIYTLQEWICKGKESGITISGELFYAKDLCQFANSHGLETVLEPFNDFNIVLHLTLGNMIGLAYDSDKNHFPFNNSGNCAHWGLIHGFTFSKSAAFTINLESSIESNNLSVEYIRENLENLCFLIRQGKSKYSRWIPSKIIKDSNGNLEYVKSDLNSKLHVIPSSLKSTLANLILVFKKH